MKISLGKLIAHIVLFGSFMCAPALAHVIISDGRPANLNGQPVTVGSCSAEEQDDNGTTNSLVVDSIGFSVGNNSASAIKFEFDFYDPFDTAVGTRYGEYTTSVAANITQSSIFLPTTGFLNQALGYVRCYVTQVNFQDGTKWKRPAN